MEISGQAKPGTNNRPSVTYAGQTGQPLRVTPPPATAPGLIGPKGSLPAQDSPGRETAERILDGEDQDGIIIRTRRVGFKNVEAGRTGPDRDPSGTVNTLHDLSFGFCDYTGLTNSKSSTHRLFLTLIFFACSTSEIVEESSNGNLSNFVAVGGGPCSSNRCPCGQPSCKTRSLREGSPRREGDLFAASCGDLTQCLSTGSVSS